MIKSGSEVPAQWSAALRVTLDSPTLAEPAALVQRLWPYWHARKRVVFELHDDVLDVLDPDQPLDATAAPDATAQLDATAPPDATAAPDATARDVVPWQLDPALLIYEDLLHHLVWANSVDGRDPGRPRWRLAEVALGHGAPSAAAGEGDVLVGKGTPAWCDGGPIGPLAAEVVHRVALERGIVELMGKACEPPAELAADQLAAVTHRGGAARIIAPAGSGKTRVLTERARLLLGGWKVPGSATCLVAFNKRAADEMVERTRDLRGLQIRTLNALGLAILDGRPPFRPRTERRHEVLDERQVRRILDGIVDLPRSKRRANTDPMAAWIDALSAVRLGLRDPAEVEDELSGDVDGLADVVLRYRETLARTHQLDFDEQIVSAIQVLLSEPETRRAAQRACRLMLVDEFQDLTPAHLLLVRLLASPDLAVFGVGDDDQTIYGYTGATPEWLIGYAGLFPGSGDHPLEVNYRCPPAVVDAADRLLRHNRRRVPKAVRPDPQRRPEAGELTIQRSEDTVTATLEAVTGALHEGAKPGQLAVLTRVNASLAPVQVALVHAGIPVRPAVDERWLERTGVRAALAWLRLATRPQTLRAVDVADTVRRPGRGLSMKVVEWMAEQRTLEGMERLATRLRDRDSDKIVAYLTDLRMLVGVAGRGTTADVLGAVRDRIGLDEAMDLLDASKRSVTGSAQTDDLDALVAVARLQPDPSAFEAWLRQQLSGNAGSPVERETADRVVLSTVHAVKGREWPHVVVHEASAGLFPHRLAADKEEERRVFHVAITRAQQRCTVVCGDSPSPFAAELSTEPPAHDPRPPGRLVTSAGRRPLDRPSPAKPGAKAPAQLDAEGDTLRTALKAWRSERARRDGVPAYVVFHDETLDLIAAARPRNAVALSRLKGIGPAKLDRYGDEVLAVVDEVASAG
ncbi:MAG: ATP-dependent helicase UvrD/PcrA [Acidimicrobiia bacterium]|nr:ATP-dependent helicase UvrD/PcrA [Acidimicrobiia bacterium]